MTQRTATSLIEALMWVHINSHHESGNEWSDVRGEYTHRWFKNYHDTLRIPMKAPWYSRFLQLVQSNPRPHDDRMHALTQTGRRILQRAELVQGFSIDWKAHP